MANVRVLLAAAALLLGLFGFWTQRASILRALRSDSGKNSRSLAAAPAAIEKLPNCGIPARAAKAIADCKAEQSAYYGEHKSALWGGGGFERTMASLFNRYEGREYFPRTRPITIVHVGAHLGSMIDRYASLLRGPRLDDRLILVEPNPANVERIRRRIRLDPRLSVLHAPVYEKSGPVWFEFGNVPNGLGSGGRVKLELPANTTEAEAGGTGMALTAVTLDELLKDVPIIDFIMMDAEGHEPYILKGASSTLSRTRLLVMGCGEKWKEMPAGYQLGESVALLQKAGLLTTLLGEKRNIILDSEVVPEGLEKDIVTWGFCMSQKVSPPIIHNTTFGARLLAGPDAFDAHSPCSNYAATASQGSCSGDVLKTLGALDPNAPQPSPWTSK